jgi:hypothetical protein
LTTFCISSIVIGELNILFISGDRLFTKAYNNCQFRLENELRTTSKTNSKEFWKILNSFLKMIKIYLWKFYINIKQ